MHVSRTPSTPTKGNPDLLAFYTKDLYELVNFDLPYAPEVSPNNLARSDDVRIVSQINFLFYQARPKLDEVLCVLAAHDAPERTQACLLDILSKTVHQVRYAKIKSPLGLSTPETGLRLSATRSARSDGPKVSRVHNSKDNQRERLDEQHDRQGPDLMPPPSSPTLAIKHNTALTMTGPLVPSLQKLSVDTSLTTSALTSFASSKKSFASVFSELKGSQETVATVATSDDEEDINEISPRHEIGQQHNQPAALKALDRSTEILDYRIRNIPKDGIARDLPESMLTLPYPLRIAAYRASHHCAISNDELDAQWSHPRTSETLLSFVNKHKTRKSRPLVIDSEARCRERPLLARLVWSEEGDRIFKLELQPYQRVTLNIFERHFGAHRFLIVDSCQINKPIGRFQGSSKEIEEQALLMLGREQSFLGRTWVQMLPKDRKRERDFSNDPNSSAPSTYKLYFFATCGEGLEPISMTQLINWYIPLHLNLHQPASKVFARLDLALSRGTPACTFSCSQIRYGNYGLPDVKSNNASEAWSNRWDYDDEKREQEFGGDIIDTEEVMSDGCAWISIAAMDRVRKALGLTYIPTAVQARIFGAKGVWCCAGEELPDPVTPEDVWIDITQSQVKVRRDINAETDEELRSLEVLKYTHKLSTSYLYTGFMPIMVHRGVPQQTILDAADCHIKAAVNELMDALQDSSLLHRWLHVKRDLVRKRERETERWLAYKSIDDREERVVKMLEHGLKPAENKFLSEEITVTVQWLLDREVRNTKIPSFQSTSAIGIPDLLGILNPGEIQVNFSEAIYDPTSNKSWSTLQDMDVLIARNPSQRDSDIQKVRAVHRRELSHLRDVIIFSTQGRRSLASKLSGGDYDGDIFVVYWCPKLVQPFRNAPAPEQLTPLKDMFISVDRKKLEDIVPSARLGPVDDSEICTFIRRQSAARMQFSYLGMVSNAYGDLTYPNNDLNTLTANKYNDLHDYLVDADKNGYSFTKTDFIRFQERYGASRHGEPQYRIFLKSKDKSYGELQAGETSKRFGRRTHILDKLYLDVLMEEMGRGMTRVKKCLSAAMTRDTDLERPYDQVWESTEVSSVLRTELESLKRHLGDLVKAWQVGSANYHATGRQPDVWAQLVSSLRMRYREIKPDHPGHAAVAEWCRPQGNDLNMWDKLKASALARLHYQKYRMIYTVALDDLCRIKSQVSAYRCIIMSVYVHMRPRKRKSDEISGDLRDSSDAESDYGDSESLLYVLDDLSRDERVSPEISRTPLSRKRVLRGLGSHEEI